MLLNVSHDWRILEGILVIISPVVVINLSALQQKPEDYVGLQRATFIASMFFILFCIISIPPVCDLSIFTVRHYALHGICDRNSVLRCMVFAIVILSVCLCVSVCLSVCHTRGLCPHGSTYDRDFFTRW